MRKIRKQTFLQERLKTFQMKEKTWGEKAKQFVGNLKEKDVKNNKLVKQVQRLQIQLSMANKKISQLQQTIKSQNKSDISSQSTQPKSGQSNKWLSQQKEQPTVKPLLNPLVYVKELQQKANLPQQEIYFRQGDYYILNHSNVEINLQKFFEYDWTSLKQLNLYNSKMDYKKWKQMVYQAFRFPNLEVLYLFGNNVRMVQKDEVRMFDKLCQVVLHNSDQVKSMKAFSKLQNNAEVQKPKIVIKQKPVIVVKQAPKPKMQQYQERITYQ